MDFIEGIKEIFKGTNRGFKGFTIIFFIYGSGMFLAALIISTLTKRHEDVDKYEKGDKDPTVVEHDRQVLTRCLLGLGIAFYVLSVFSFIMKQRFKNIPGISASEMERKRLLKAYGDDVPDHLLE